VSLLANLGRVLASDAVLSTLDQANATAPATSTLKLSADLHWRRKEWMAAIEAASRVIYREPKDFHALAILVTSYGHLEQYEAAQVYAKQLVLLRPPSWTATKTVLNLLRFFRLFTADGRAGPIFEGASVRTLQRWYDDAITAAGVAKKGGPHTARHTFATILRAKGFSLEEIQGMLGHSTRITTEIYAKLTFTPEVRDRYLQLFEGGAYKNS